MSNFTDRKITNEMKRNGILKFFNLPSQYGFVIDEESGKEYFFAGSEVRTAISKGDKVEYELGNNKNGPCALKVGRCGQSEEDK